MKMMSGINGKKKLSVLLMASLLAAAPVFADSYKNNVVDVKVNKESNNAVKVTIYTDRPYTEPVVVNKKANNKYVILMPETKSNLKGSPKMTNVSGTVSNVSVNTQSVSGGKGYTKIIITSEHAINVVPRTQQLATSKKPVTTANKSAQTKAVAKAQKPTAQKTAKTATAKPAKSKATEAKKPTGIEKIAKSTHKPLIKKTTKPTTAKKQKPTVKPVTKTVKPQTAPIKTAVKPKQPIDILEHEVKTNTSAPLVDSQNDDVLNKEIQNNEAKLAEKNKSDNIKEPEQKQQVETENTAQQNKFDLGALGIWKLLLLVGAITFPIIVIMIILGLDRKINKKIEKSFRREDNTQNPYPDLPEEQQPAYEQPQQPQPLPEPEQPAAYTSFDDMLNKVETEPEQTYQEQLQNNENNTPSEEPFKNDFSDDDFVHDFSDEATKAGENVSQTIEEITQNQTPSEAAPVVPEIIEQPKTEPEEPKKVETDTTAGEDNTQTQEPLIDKPAELAVPEKVTPDESQYNPDGYLSDFNGIDDKDFFDELAMQTMAQNNADGLPEQSPADEIFDYMNDDTEPEEESKSAEPEDIIYNEEEKEEAQQLTEPVSEKAESTKADTKNDEDNLTMLTEVKLNDNSGIYLVNYDNFSSLVGHINDDYFVLKKFDDVVEDKIYLKETEKTKDATRYLVRVGKNKMIIEVSSNSMSRLLDL